MNQSSIKILFFSILILSPFFALSSENWFQVWMALEINMMAFIPFMFFNNKTSTMSMMKYFIIQALASAIFLSSNILYIFNMMLLKNITLFLALSTKLGLPPIFFWFPQIIESLNEMCFIMIMTWQKIIPLYLMNTLQIKFLMSLILISCLIGTLGMFNQTSINKILAYSSMIHMSWMLALTQIKSNMLWFYWSIYTFITINIIQEISFFNLKTISQMSNMMMLNQTPIIIYMMSLGGFPPLLGFLSKWVTISSLSNFNPLIQIFLISSSLISIFIYLKILYPLFFKNSMNFMIKKQKPLSNFYMSVNIIPVIGILPILF